MNHLTDFLFFLFDYNNPELKLSILNFDITNYMSTPISYLVVCVFFVSAASVMKVRVVFRQTVPVSRFY